MTDFRKVYKDAAGEIKQPGIDAHSVFDEVRRRKVRRRRMLQEGATIASAVLLIGIGGFTTATAAGYLGSMIRVGEHGFVSGDVYTMTDTFPGTEEGKQVQAAGSRSEDALLEAENAAAEVVEMEPLEEQQFDSVETFRRECPEAVVALPQITTTGDEKDTEMVCVMGDSIYVHYQVSEEQSIDLQRYDYHGSMGHAASISFCGEICNERCYTTEQNFTYTLIDEKRRTDDEALRIHAAVSVGSYEVYVNFYGYEEEAAVRILESMDLSVYCMDE